MQTEAPYLALFTPLSGELRTDVPSAFIVVRDGMFFLPAFLEHHRRIGFRQFCFIDDRSTDGTREYLAGQEDCAVFASPHRYGDAIPAPEAGRTEKAAHAWKREFPRRYFDGKWLVVLDVDEFLHLPTAHTGIDELFSEADRRGVTRIPAVMVDLYPERAAELRRQIAPRSIEDFVAAYPCFDRGPYFEWVPGKSKPDYANYGLLARKFAEHGIRKPGRGSISSLFRQLFKREALKSTLHKIPVVRWVAGTEMVGAHRTNNGPDCRALLTIAHFKLTCDLWRRMDYAIKSGAYSNGSRKYSALDTLLERMMKRNEAFLFEGSRRYGGSKGFEESGLMRGFEMKPAGATDQKERHP
jgi:hypothetical protein